MCPVVHNTHIGDVFSIAQTFIYQKNKRKSNNRQVINTIRVPESKVKAKIKIKPNLVM